MSKISNITIQNIKGFGESNNSFNVDIDSKKINILVAPNGFGKSSIAAAFSGLSRNKLILDKSLYHKGDDSRSISLSIKEEGQNYIANMSRNEISSRFKVFCIKNRLYAKAVSQNMGRFSNASGHMAIESIKITAIPDKEQIAYSINHIKRSFGSNSRILKNFKETIFENPHFLENVDSIYGSLDKLSAKKRNKIISRILDSINSLTGRNTDQIINQIDIDFLNELKSDIECLKIYNYIKEYSELDNDIDIFSCFYQLIIIYFEDKSSLKKSVKRAKYDIFKNTFNENLALIGSTWKNIKSQEKKNELLVNFPKADYISYGQRDSLTLCIELQRIKSLIRAGDRCIIIVDEVFDYLDDVNLTATQFYLSEILNTFKTECIIYPILLTHLSPEYFRNFVFSPKRTNVIYLKEGAATPNSNMKKLLKIRENDSVGKEIRYDISHFLLHYSTGSIDRREEFKTHRLKELWGESNHFLKDLVQEVNSYLSGNLSFCPYMISAAIRIRIEKHAYDTLSCHEHKNEFININSTKKKLEYVEDVTNKPLPDIYYILGIIYNDTLHLSKNVSDKPVIYRLNSLVIQNMIKNIFSFSPTKEVTLTDIH